LKVAGLTEGGKAPECWRFRLDRPAGKLTAYGVSAVCTVALLFKA